MSSSLWHIKKHREKKALSEKASVRFVMILQESMKCSPNMARMNTILEESLNKYSVSTFENTSKTTEYPQSTIFNLICSPLNQPIGEESQRILYLFAPCLPLAIETFPLFYHFQDLTWQLMENIPYMGNQYLKVHSIEVCNHPPNSWMLRNRNQLDTMHPGVI